MAHLLRNTAHIHIKGYMPSEVTSEAKKYVFLVGHMSHVQQLGDKYLHGSPQDAARQS